MNRNTTISYFKNIKIIIVFLFIFATSCENHTGHYSVGVPIALDPVKTELSLQEQQKIVSDPESIGLISPFEVNRGHFRSSNQSQSMKIAKNFTSPKKKDAENPSLSSLTSNNVLDATSIVTINPEPLYKGLVMDGFTSLESFSAHKVNIRENFDYSTLTKGNQGSLYKIKFNISVNPLRQDYWTYIWRVFEFYNGNGFRNYTKDYHAEISFEICNKDAEVVLVQPVNEGLNSYEMALMQTSSQFTAGGVWHFLSGELDFAERHREQLVQQLKHPIIRGAVDSVKKFHFTISPRIYITERFFRIPFFMS